MHGAMLNSFFDHVEQAYGKEILSSILRDIGRPACVDGSRGGELEERTLVSALQSLGRQTNKPLPILLDSYGRYIFSDIARTNPAIFDGAEHSLSLLRDIFTQVPEELPLIQSLNHKQDCLELIFRSNYPLAPMAAGVLTATGDYFHEHLDIRKSDLSAQSHTHVRFELRRVA